MYKIEILPHTADIRIKIEADSLEELFRAGLKSMSSLLKENISDREGNFQLERSVELDAVDTTALLIDFLSDVLTKSYIEKAVFSQLKVNLLQENYIKAAILGKRVKGFDEDIKAVTYHEAEVQQNSGKWLTNIIFDI